MNITWVTVLPVGLDAVVPTAPRPPARRNDNPFEIPAKRRPPLSADAPGVVAVGQAVARMRA